MASLPALTDAPSRSTITRTPLIWEMIAASAKETSMSRCVITDTFYERPLFGRFSPLGNYDTPEQPRVQAVLERHIY